MSKIIYFDCPTGISGDMILSALIDCGIELDYLKKQLNKLPLPKWQIDCIDINKNHLHAKQMHISYESTDHAHHLADIKKIITAAHFPLAAEKTACAIFEKLAQAEATVHGSSIEKIHFHEVGATDAIIDICGAALALDYLKIEKVYSSPLPLSHGFVECAHGQIAVPAPAVLELLKTAKLTSSQLQGELITPTGATILMTILDNNGFSAPDFVLQKTGRGAGQRDLPTANILRVLMGESEQKDVIDIATCWVDDTQPEILGYLWEKLLSQEGILDMAYMPILMKKGRPAWQISVITTAGSGEKTAQMLMSETSTIGVRLNRENRVIFPRKKVAISTKYGTIEIKVSGEGENATIAPEYEDCANAAQKHQVPLKTVYQTAIATYSKNNL